MHLPQSTRSAIRRFVRDEKGATFVEYIVLVGFIAIIGIAAFTTFGGDVAAVVGGQATTVNTIPQK